MSDVWRITSLHCKETVIIPTACVNELVYLSDGAIWSVSSTILVHSTVVIETLHFHPCFPFLYSHSGNEDLYSNLNFMKDTHFGPADMTGHFSSVQNSVMVPKSIFIWLKKSTAEKEQTKNWNEYNFNK